jgi:hypothetical protein
MGFFAFIIGFGLQQYIPVFSPLLIDGGFQLQLVFFNNLRCCDRPNAMPRNQRFAP